MSTDTVYNLVTTSPPVGKLLLMGELAVNLGELGLQPGCLICHDMPILNGCEATHQLEAMEITCTF